MTNGPTHLQFTIADRDMLRDTSNGVKQILEKLDTIQERVANLERSRDEVRGAAYALKLLWAVVVAVLGIFGWHISKHP